MYWRQMETTALILLCLVLLSSGCVADATPEVTYKSKISENTLVLTGDGFVQNNGVPDDTFIWTSNDGVKRGYWYKTSKEDNRVFLQMGSFFSDLPLIIKDDSIFWPNGSEWTKQ